ncbi:MAG: cupin domain-containing protein [Candidatus Cloacimonetes bacterium]|nr:cupin domain-containing protein [Candidatus Cloacimonadota bacterium]
MSNIYPEMITSLPEIEIGLPGLRGWLLQGLNSQLVLFEIEPIGRMPEHSHTAQWGIVLEGEMKLSIAGETRIYRRGDRYFIPEGIKHSAEFLTKVYVIDFFADPNRYQVKDKE